MRCLNIALISGLIFAPLTLSAAEAAKSNGEKLSVEVTEKPKLTREYLLANGFKQSAKNPDSFTVESVRLGDISKKLNFPLSALRRTVSSAPESDMRIVTVRDMEFVVRSEVHGPDFRAVERSFKNPDTLCTVGVSLKKRVPPKPPLKSDSTPRLRVKSVTVPKDRAKPLQVTFELSAEGKTPVGLIQDQFNAYITQGDSQAFTGTVQFPAHSVHRVLVKPGSPITYTVSVPDEPTILEGGWKGLDPGKYTLQVIIEGGGLWKGMGFDYLWLEGEPHGQKVESNKFEFIVPKD